MKMCSDRRRITRKRILAHNKFEPVMREFPLECSYDFGVALCGTFPEIKRIQFVLLPCILRDLTHLIMFALWGRMGRCGRLRTTERYSRRIKNSRGRIPDECSMQEIESKRTSPVVAFGPTSSTFLRSPGRKENMTESPISVLKQSPKIVLVEISIGTCSFHCSRFYFESLYVE